MAYTFSITSKISFFSLFLNKKNYFLTFLYNCAENVSFAVI